MTSKNIFWQHSTVSREQRRTRNRHRPGVLWLTGLPSAGKSTIALELQARLFEMGCQVYVLDGDNIRHGLNKNLGFSREDRTENIRRVAEVARLFCDAGFLTVTAFISPYTEDRASARALLDEGNFIEIYVKTSVEECERRDPKGNYARARKGEIQNFTGVSADYEEPPDPEIVLDTEQLTPQQSVDKIIGHLQADSFF